ncbi:preprotein translocase subunit SecE [bacterium]|nr:preprotein translocase subunit SecE [bacterium]
MKRLIRYFKSSYHELRRVIWPNRQQAIFLTSVVLIFTAVVAIYLAGFDLLFRTILEKLLTR